MGATHPYPLLGAVEPGTVIGHWTVIREAQRRSGLRHLLCRCVCGIEREIFIGNLRTGKTSSCGCQTKARTHGLSSTPENLLWRMMKQRCNNPKHRGYKDYGGRGITVCERWSKSFHAFIEDVGMRPSPELTLERINNERNYEPGNVRWATRTEQAANTRWTHEQRATHGRKNAMKRWHPESHSDTPK